MPGPADVGRFALGVVGTALAYALTAWASLALSRYVGDMVAVVWLAAGVAAAAALRLRWAGLLGVLLGAFAVSQGMLPQSEAAIVAAAAMTSAGVFMLLPRYFAPFTPALDRVASVAKFALGAAPLAAAIAAVATVVVGYLSGAFSSHVLMRAVWVGWLGNMMGMYLAGPLLLTVSSPSMLPRDRRTRIEGLLLVVTMLALTLLMMHYAKPLRPAEAVLFILMPIVLWAALRFSVAGASRAIFLAAAIAFGVTVASYGGIGPTTSAADVLALQISTMTMALAGLFVSAAVTEHRHSEMQLNVMANHDALTGLPNRSYFQDFLSHALARAQRDRAQVSLLFIDLDRFKHINDSQGHEVGDQVLRIVAARLEEQLRADDFVARLGGDEFAVILSHPPASRAAARVARKLLDSLAESFRLGPRRYAIGASIGISVYPDDGLDAATLLRQADLAMYQAKERRSGFEYFSDELNVAAQQQLALETGLRKALERDELALVYQPKVDLVTGKVVGLEALIRWLTRTGNIIGPDQFIPVAEETGLIVPIGRWAVRKGCEQWIEWRDAGLNPPPVAINLSPRQFSDTRLIEDIDAILAQTGMHTAYLQFEVTESAAMENPARTFEMLDALRKRGVRLYIDDFGTGHSNLGQLKRMPIDALKIDKSFVSDVLTDSDDAEITNAIIRLAHALNLRVVAEGVETFEQVAFLRQNGCDEIQGYVVSKPVAPAKVSLMFGRTFSLR